MWWVLEPIIHLLNIKQKSTPVGLINCYDLSLSASFFPPFLFLPICLCFTSCPISLPFFFLPYSQVFPISWLPFPHYIYLPMSLCPVDNTKTNHMPIPVWPSILQTPDCGNGMSTVFPGHCAPATVMSLLSSPWKTPLVFPQPFSSLV